MSAYHLKDGTVSAWQVGSGPMPWWVVDQAPCGPNVGKSYVNVRTAHGDVDASMGDYIVKGIGRWFIVLDADDFCRSFRCEEGADAPLDRRGFEEAQRAAFRKFAEERHTSEAA